jgi:hypothetical protein
LDVFFYFAICSSITNVIYIAAAWQQHSMALEQQGLRIEPVLPDLVDKIWTDDRPEFPDTVINPYPLKYAGELRYQL